MYFMQDTGSSIDPNFQQFEPLLMKYKVGRGRVSFIKACRSWVVLTTFSPLAPAQVDLMLWGHVHNALVTCPGTPHEVQMACNLNLVCNYTHFHLSATACRTVYNGTCMTPSTPGGYDAPVHAVIGNGGQSLSGLPKVRAPWDIYHANEFGYSTITAHNATVLEVSFRSSRQWVGGHSQPRQHPVDGDTWLRCLLLT
jgi:hypothetical protein